MNKEESEVSCDKWKMEKERRELWNVKQWNARSGKWSARFQTALEVRYSQCWESFWGFWSCSDIREIQHWTVTSESLSHGNKIRYKYQMGDYWMPIRKQSNGSWYTYE